MRVIAEMAKMAAQAAGGVRKHAALAAAAGAIALAACAADSGAAAGEQAAAPAAAVPVEVVSARFGIYGTDPVGRRVLFETSHFPADSAAPYGWFIVYKTSKPTVIWREEFELPQALDNWGPGEALGFYTISPDRKTAVTERVVPTRVGFIANEWRYAPGDPIGAHAMRIYIDGQLIREFRFDIEDGPGNEEAPARRNPHGLRSSLI